MHHIILSDKFKLLIKCAPKLSNSPLKTILSGEHAISNPGTCSGIARGMGGRGGGKIFQSLVDHFKVST